MLDYSKQIKANSTIPERCIKKRRLPFKNSENIRHNVDKLMHNKSKHTALEIKILKDRKQRSNGAKFNKLPSSIKHSIRIKTSCIKRPLSNRYIY